MDVLLSLKMVALPPRPSFGRGASSISVSAKLVLSTIFPGSRLFLSNRTLRIASSIDSAWASIALRAVVSALDMSPVAMRWASPLAIKDITAGLASDCFYC